MGLARSLGHGSKSFAMHLLKSYLFNDYSQKWSKTTFKNPKSNESQPETDSNLLSTVVSALIDSNSDEKLK